MPDITSLSVMAGVIALVSAAMRIIEILVRKLSSSDILDTSITDKQNIREIRDWAKSIYDMNHEHYNIIFNNIIKNQQDIKDKLYQVANILDRVEKHELTIKCPLVHNDRIELS